MRKKGISQELRDNKNYPKDIFEKALNSKSMRVI